jgi:hypothetical protein
MLTWKSSWPNNPYSHTGQGDGEIVLNSEKFSESYKWNLCQEDSSCLFMNYVLEFSCHKINHGWIKFHISLREYVSVICPYGTNAYYHLGTYHVFHSHNSNRTLPFNTCMLSRFQVFTEENSKLQPSGMWHHIPGRVVHEVLKEYTDFMLKWCFFLCQWQTFRMKPLCSFRMDRGTFPVLTQF